MGIFDDIPKAAVFVRAGILSAGLIGVGCGGAPPTDQTVDDHEQDQNQEQEQDSYEYDRSDDVDPPPTCGPCCHGGGPDCED